MDFGSLLLPRSIEDILAERVRLNIGGKVIDLPALSINENEAWLASLDAEIGGLMTAIGNAGDDIPAIVSAVTAQPARLLDVLYTYDKTGALPPKDELRSVVTPVGLLRAVAEVWRAANPLVDIGLAGMTADLPANVSPLPTSSRRKSGAGRRGKSVAS